VIFSTVHRLDRASHVPHALHREPGVFGESNCYVDLWIELLHALGFNPHAMLAHVLTVDFEGDQWTFFKPPVQDLQWLYGIDVQELQIWDGIERQVLVQLARGRLVLTEVDAFHLPDTAGTTYRSTHEKTTIGIERVDTDARKVGYFHNAGYHWLEGDDFNGVLDPESPLPPYVEFVKLERAERLANLELRRRSRALLARHLERRPMKNPIIVYDRRFDEHARWFAGDLGRFHAYAFATLRQCGSAYELGARYLRWLLPDETNAIAAADDLDAIAIASKTALLRLARSAMNGKVCDLKALLMAAPRWDSAFHRLGRCAARLRGKAA
jgi:hypothetical protein